MHPYLRNELTFLSSRWKLPSTLKNKQVHRQFASTSTYSTASRHRSTKANIKVPPIEISKEKSNLQPFGQRMEKLQVNGHTLNWDVVGTGEHVILLLPGALGSIQTDFCPIVDKFDSTRYTIVSWDPPGYGWSRPPNRDFSGEYLRRDAHTVVQLMNKLGYDKYSILGWSNGGTTGGFIAADYPSKVHKLVNWGTHAYLDKRVVNFTKMIRDLDTWNPKMLEPLLTMYGTEYLMQLLQNWHSAVSEMYESGMHLTYKKCMPNIKCPTLTIHGEQDPIVGVEQAEHHVKHIANSKMWILPKAKHNLHLRQTDEFMKVVTKFLDS